MSYQSCLCGVAPVCSWFHLCGEEHATEEVGERLRSSQRSGSGKPVQTPEAYQRIHTAIDFSVHHLLWKQTVQLQPGLHTQSLVDSSIVISSDPELESFISAALQVLTPNQCLLS